ncbi:MAG: molybdate ABC transporter substrate-binding protein, partial [Patescibacteria group bacterium]|nr:molybdate ABC transporter substrate-binding protein [Patescibacteria group bacterium]
MSVRTMVAACAALAALLVLGRGFDVWSSGYGRHQGVEKRVSVFAAAGATDALGGLADEYQRRHHVAIDLSFASSSTLARQIEAGAPAEVYLSANAQWTDHLERAGLLTPGSRRELTANRLVLIVPKGES